MHKKLFDKFKNLDPKKRNIAIAAIVVLAIILILLAVQLLAPQRSVASYCQVYKEEKTRLATFPGDTYPSGVFNETLSDASQFATSFGKLEKVAPDEIRPDVATLRLIYQKIHDDPSQAISASLSGVGAETNVKSWTNSHCGNQ